jgi:hypothetical protein
LRARGGVEQVVLEADELDQVGIRQQALVDPDGPRLRVGLRVVDRDVDLQGAEVRAPEAFDDLPSDVSGAPFTSSQPPSRKFVLSTMRESPSQRPARVAPPPRLHVRWRCRPAIQKDLPHSRMAS